MTNLSPAAQAVLDASMVHSGPAFETVRRMLAMLCELLLIRWCLLMIYSRDHIGWAFMTWRGWKPEAFTDTGRPKIDEGILDGFPYVMGCHARLMKVSRS
jgi:hypothetical protein